MQYKLAPSSRRCEDQIGFTPSATRLAASWRRTKSIMAKTRPYLFYDTATSICHICLQRVEAKILIKDGSVFMDKWCRDHGMHRVLVADDADYYRRSRELFIKPPEMPQRFNTPMKHGCPYDCGICPDHMQHACLTLVEVTDHCNLSCPICYAESGPHRPGFKSLEAVERMLDAAVANEGEPDVVQISGGEPTLHPQFFEILDAARSRPIRHLMVNTNGIRIAKDAAFAERLASYAPAFEVYLQFDSLNDDHLMVLRGAKLADIRLQALERLNALNLSTTLVVTVKKNLNDGELGGIIDFALKQRCVRGVTFQPVQAAGRLENFDPARDRLTLTEVRRKIYEQSSVFTADDIIPVPCNPDSLAMAYALKLDTGVVPLSRYVSAETLTSAGRNTIVFERDEELKAKIAAGFRDKLFQTFSTNHSPESQACSLSDLLCCLPHIEAPSLQYDNVFRVLIMAFIDAWSFDVRAVKKSCVHIAQEDGKMIPFDTYNLFYRNNKIAALTRSQVVSFV